MSSATAPTRRPVESGGAWLCDPVGKSDRAMARIEPVPPEEMDDETRAALAEVQDRRSEMTRLMAPMAHRPAMVQTPAARAAAVFETGTVEQRLKEMLAVRVSQINDCGY